MNEYCIAVLLWWFRSPYIMEPSHIRIEELRFERADESASHQRLPADRVRDQLPAAVARLGLGEAALERSGEIGPNCT